MDFRKASPKPPAGLHPSLVPQFVTVGFDDNGFSGLKDPNTPWGITWADRLFASRTNPPGIGNARTFDSMTCHASFYCTTGYIAEDLQGDPPDMVKRAWHNAFDAGHEFGSHSHGHQNGTHYTVAEWKSQIQQCNDWLKKPAPAENAVLTGSDIHTGAGIPASALYGFRAPFLLYNDALFSALQQEGFLYDCSIEEGWQEDQDGTNFLWPYTLDHGSPGHDAQCAWPDTELEQISAHPGLWEMPVHAVVVPPDRECPRYGVPAGLREKLYHINTDFKPAQGKITGIDWNILVEYKMGKAEFLAILKYTLDQRLSGNRCPFIFSAHSDMYSPGYDFPPNISWQERQQVLEEFITYAASKPQVRIVSVIDMLNWIRNPVPL